MKNSEVFQYKYDDLFNPTLKALHNLNGSASVSEIDEAVAAILNLSEEQINVIHRGSVTKLHYRLAWARNYLKRFGLLENSSRGVWALTSLGTKTVNVNKEEVKKAVKALGKRKASEDESEDESEEIAELDWQAQVLEIIQGISPDSFERLTQRVLREIGFVNVEVTGRSGDGGIDGKGVIKLGGVLSFHVVFQCKRYKGSIAPNLIRDFRGAMIGRADKGLFITTGHFSRDAKKEAQRDGAPPIDTIDGIEFVNKLKQFELGVNVDRVEKIKINEKWFAEF